MLFLLILAFKRFGHCKYIKNDNTGQLLYETESYAYCVSLQNITIIVTRERFGHKSLLGVSAQL